MPSHCSCYLKYHPVSLHKPYFKWHDSIFKLTTKMGYSACCFTIDVNMFWIFILFCFFPCSHKKLCLIKKVFNLLYKQLIFISLDASGLVSFSRNGGQVNVALHGGQRFNLASRPAPFPLPQAAGGADAKPAVAPGLADDLFIVVDVGYPSDGHHAGLQHLQVCVCVEGQLFSSEQTPVSTKPWCRKPHLHLLLRRELDDGSSVDFAQQNAARPFTQRKDAAREEATLDLSR